MHFPSVKLASALAGIDGIRPMHVGLAYEKAEASARLKTDFLTVSDLLSFVGKRADELLADEVVRYEKLGYAVLREANLGYARLRASATVLSLIANRNVCGSQIDLLTGLALRLCLSDVSEGKGLPRASDLAYRLCNALSVDDAEKEAIAEEGADAIEEIAEYLNDPES